VARGFFAGVPTPAMPSSRISRSTVQRATLTPAAFSSSQIFRAP
jgi:hypothetical protein